MIGKWKPEWTRQSFHFNLQFSPDFFFPGYGLSVIVSLLCKTLFQQLTPVVNKRKKVRNKSKVVRYTGSSITAYLPRDVFLWLLQLWKTSISYVALLLILTLVVFSLVQEPSALCFIWSVVWIYPQTYFINRYLTITQKN